MLQYSKFKKQLKFYFVSLLLVGSFFLLQVMTQTVKANSTDDDTTIAGSTLPIGIEIIGETGPVTEPRIICTPKNRFFIIWKDDYISFNSTFGVYDFNDTVYIQELNLDGSLKGDSVIIYRKTDFNFLDITATKDVSIVADSENNLHILWYLMHTNGSSSGGQFDLLFYTKLNSSLEAVLEPKILFSREGYGYGSSPLSSSYIDDLVIDEYSNIHFLFDSKYYFIIDDEGDVLDFFDMYDAGVGNEDPGISDSLMIDKMNNTFITSIDSYDYIHLTKFSNMNGNISHLFTKELFYNDVDFLLHSRLHNVQDKFYISYLHDHVLYIYYEFNSTGHLIQQVDLALRKGKLSNNQSLVYDFNLFGRAEFHEDKEFQYTLYDVNNSLIHDSGPILIIASNPSHFYGPDVFYLQCIEDLDENLWLTWYVNDGSGGKQVMYWKISVTGVSLRPVTSIAPTFHVYTFIVVPEFHYFNYILWFVVMTLISIISFASRRRQKKFIDGC